MVKEEDFLCPCGKCDQAQKPDQALVAAVKQIERWVYDQIQITSGVRCPAHNEEVGGTKGSMHLTGEACDIAISNSVQAFTIFCAALSVPDVNFYEVCPHHLHIDIRPGPKRLIVGNG